jgi:hypothetical protein
MKPRLRDIILQGMNLDPSHTRTRVIDPTTPEGATELEKIGEIIPVEGISSDLLILRIFHPATEETVESEHGDQETS